MHLSDEQIQRLLHSELSSGPARAVAAHLDACPTCRERATAARAEEQELHGLLASLDHQVPRLDAHTLAARAGRRREWLRYAAAVALVLAAGAAAYAWPGSPVRVWLGRPEAPRAAAPAAPSGAAAWSGGIAVEPGTRLVIEFVRAQPAATARITLAEQSEVVVRVSGGTASFTTQPERLLIDNRGDAASFAITLPRAARYVDVVVAGRRLFRKDADAITSKARPAPDGGYTFSLAAPD